ncbi:MAG: radical SAM protein, partial [Deltaproteobacteria bacterium]|nr:radical SAM protein [Deltaproteobacteria bacterium]
KGLAKLELLAAAGLKRIHVGLESGDDAILTQVRKGADSRTLSAAGRLVRQAGIELNAYVILGLGGREQTASHARETARVLNDMQPHVVRLRTLVPKINTPLFWRISRPGGFSYSAPTGSSGRPWP